MCVGGARWSGTRFPSLAWGARTGFNRVAGVVLSCRTSSSLDGMCACDECMRCMSACVCGWRAGDDMGVQLIEGGDATGG